VEFGCCACGLFNIGRRSPAFPVYTTRRTGPCRAARRVGLLHLHQRGLTPRAVEHARHTNEERGVNAALFLITEKLSRARQFESCGCAKTRPEAALCLPPARTAGPGIESERLKDGRRNLHRLNGRRYSGTPELGFDSSIITLVSSWEKPPCSASFLVLPE
jgi:hypothetical protein